MTDAPMDKSGLLPCPFCGNKVGEQSFWYSSLLDRGCHVFCLECSETDALDGPRRDTLEEAITAWNTRSHSPAIGEQGAVAWPEMVEYQRIVADQDLTDPYWQGYRDCLLLAQSLRKHPDAAPPAVACLPDRDAVETLLAVAAWADSDGETWPYAEHGGRNVGDAIRHAIRALSAPPSGAGVEACTGCQQPIEAADNTWFCDRTEGQWHGPCFNATDCGRGDHCEECPTLRVPS